MAKKPTIKYMFTTINRTIYSNKKNEYGVVHWVGAVSTAKANALYFKSKYRGASANFFVDEYEIWCVVSPKNAAWHCGGGSQGSGGKKFFGKCKNMNSVGIELCCKRDKNGNLYIPEKTLKRAAQLVQWLQDTYNIPDSKIIRHYDVTGKRCPGVYISESKWTGAKKVLLGKTSTATVAYPTVTLKKGSSGTQVKKLQICLNKLIKAGLDVDGEFGSKTLAAVKKFQKKYGLEVDGIAGPKTRAKIKELL